MRHDSPTTAATRRWLIVPDWTSESAPGCASRSAMHLRCPECAAGCEELGIPFDRLAADPTVDWHGRCALCGRAEDIAAIPIVGSLPPVAPLAGEA